MKHEKAMRATIATVFILCGSIQSAFAQEYVPEFTPPVDTAAQVDITHGLAEQSAMHAMRSTNPAALSNPAYFQSQPNSANPVPGQFQQQPLQGYANFNSQAQQFAPQQGNCMQSYQNNLPFQSQAIPQQPFNGTQCNGGNGGILGTGLNQQMVGVLGAAVLFNYMSNGGVQNLLGEMGARGWNPQRRTLGSGGVVFH